MGALKRTPLFEVYERAGARLVDFGGWELPVQFLGINHEHLAVRERAGIFDVSHMGEIRVKGPGARDFLQRAASNDLGKISIGASQYSALLNPEGGFIDDIFIYVLDEQDYLICVNAANASKDFDWLQGLDHPDCELIDQSADFAQVAVQGPAAREIVAHVAEGAAQDIKRLGIAPLKVAGMETLAARTGYTGEDGFELFIPPDGAARVWEALLEAGGDKGLIPCGLGARDTLRLEMGYPLHGHDITPETNALEADLAWIVAMEKPEFIGKETLEQIQKKGLSRKRVGMVMEEAGVPRDGYKIFTEHGKGVVTSGTKTPCLDRAIAMGYAPIEDAVEGEAVEIEIRGKKKRARIRKWPFYRRPG